jgi:predicted nucleotidyltransferase
VNAVADPDEGVAPDGTIRTGARRDRVPALFEPVLTDAIAFSRESGASLYVYGSVTNGSARPGSSDVDLLSIGLPDAAILAQRLSARYADRCRAVEVAAAVAADFAGDSDAAYGYRVFLRHYCVHLAGPDPSASLPAFPADARAARGFNGDLGQLLCRWRTELETGSEAADLVGVRAARKSLLAVAGLVSVTDRTWTTSRSHAVQRWSELEPRLATDLSRLLSWASRDHDPARDDVEDALADDGIIAAIAARFGSLIGLWADQPGGDTVPDCDQKLSRHARPDGCRRGDAASY